MIAKLAVHRWLPPALALLVLAVSPDTAAALSIDSRASSRAGASEPGAQHVIGRVSDAVARRDADGVLRTHVVLADAAGQEVARFAVPGGLDGNVYWAVDGVPAFVVGEEVEVALVPTTSGSNTVADGDDAVTRLGPGTGGRSGAFYAPGGGSPRGGSPGSGPAGVSGTGPVAHVATVDPAGGRAVALLPLTVTVRGSGFGGQQGDSRVTFQGLFERVDARVLSWSDAEIRCEVPIPGLKGAPQILSGTVKVWTAVGGWSDGDPFVGGARFSVFYQWAGDSWSNGRLPIAVYFNPEGCPYGAAGGEILRGAFAQWNVPGSYARLVYRGLTQADGGSHGPDGTPRDGRNIVRWRTSWPHPPSWLAVTWSAIDTLTFERLETELEINGEKPWTLDPEAEPSAFDLVSTLTHEFGHWLRLGHTQQVASVMLAFTSPGVRRRDTSPGDRFGASYIHPSFGVIESAREVPSGATIDIALQVLDRQGQPRAFLTSSEIEVRAVPLVSPWIGPPGSALPGALDAPIGDGLEPGHPERPADAEGRTVARIAGLPDGLYRLEIRHRSDFVRPAPTVRVGGVPGPVAPALSLGGVAPQPLARGVRGIVRLSLPASSHVRLDLYDVRGARVRVVANQRFPEGPSEVPFQSVASDGVALPAGVYYLRMAPGVGAAFAPRTARIVILP